MAKKIAGIILAGGYSSRMGELKALLPFRTDLIIIKQIKSMNQAGIEDVYVVVGYKAKEIKFALKGWDVKVLFNEHYSEGMFSSIKTGVKAVSQEDYDGFCLLPVDYPLLQAYTFEWLMDKFNEDTAKIVYPSFNYKKGHPPLISTELNDVILSYSGDQGLKGLLKEYEEFAEYVSIGDESILIDVDTKEDYKKALEYAQKKYPNYKTCELLYEKYKIDTLLKNHCLKVGEAAKNIAILLKEKNSKLDIDPGLLYFCGLLHDLKKGTPEHAHEASKIMIKMGYYQMANIINNHMNLDSAYLNDICNESILYYADKIVKEDQFIEPQQRMDSVESSHAIKRLLDAVIIQENINKVLEHNIIELLRKMEKRH
ncbi:MAG: NTP transferase domain-containing protein [Clostridia bacterium]|nr:NTP transferase domain-containing protein [Clostridia bacterium]